MQHKSSGIFPFDWKTSKVTAIYKDGAKYFVLTKFTHQTPMEFSSTKINRGRSLEHISEKCKKAIDSGNVMAVLLIFGRLSIACHTLFMYY